jgi:hypothetical protein
LATYEEIQEYIKIKYGFEPKTCWIADVKNQCGITMRTAWNRQGERRTNPCPTNKVAILKEALKHFKMI